jgi:hypothetical protein
MISVSNTTSITPLSYLNEEKKKSKMKKLKIGHVAPIEKLSNIGLDKKNLIFS